jgi:enoyl-CoA hydratase/carnithine racemase
MRLLVLGARFSVAEALEAGLVMMVAEAKGIEALAASLGDAAALTDPTAARLTKTLLLELETGSADMNAWQAKYLANLSSESRKARVEAIKTRLKMGNR